MRHKSCDSPDWWIQTCYQSARVGACGRHCRKMQRNNKFGPKNINLATVLAEKKITGENFYLTLELHREHHLLLKVIDLCCPCLSLLSIINIIQFGS